VAGRSDSGAVTQELRELLASEVARLGAIASRALDAPAEPVGAFAFVAPLPN